MKLGDLTAAHLGKTLRYEQPGIRYEATIKRISHHQSLGAKALPLTTVQMEAPDGKFFRCTGSSLDECEIVAAVSGVEAGNE
jgi:hypothetical protein